MRRLASLARRDGGFTLPEMLTAMAIAMFISLAAFALIGFTMTRAAEVQGRVEASQKGRMAMDIITRQLRSQVCLSSTVPPIAAADANTVSFYVDMSNGTLSNPPPELHRLTYDPGTRSLTESTFRDKDPGTGITYWSTPDRTRTLLENAVPYRAPNATADTPIFRYYAFNAATPPRPDLALPAPLNSTDLGRVARIEVSFRALPPGARTNVRSSLLMQDQVYVRAADPNDPAPTPTCA
jgi:prepilin-type N-terminal cleavage/methylation domain-containing protein